MKKYKVGMYGGKFMPIHKGHMYCLSTASELCEKVYWILFYGGEEECRIMKEKTLLPRKEYLPETRIRRMKKIAEAFDNVEVIAIDISKLKNPDGSDNWDMETDMVLDACGKMDAVFSGANEYEDYFRRAYPWADCIAVDSKRKTYPISGTMVRNMKFEEASAWMERPTE